jgi:hypothetical protein
MAKAKTGLIGVEGKLGDHIISRKGRYGSYIRQVVKPGTKKHEPALKQQYSRTGFLNALASDINTMIKEHCGGLKSGQFYEKLQSRFRQEPENNRSLLLQQLKGMEINDAYPFSKHGLPVTDCTARKTDLIVRLEVRRHPLSLTRDIDSYYYEVLAATWTKKEEPGDCERQYSEWVHKKGVLPVFDFVFNRPAEAIHWMVCVRIRLGRGEIDEESFLADGMQIIDTGSFDKREQEWLLAHKQLKQKPAGVSAKQPVQIVRVKASNKN